MYKRQVLTNMATQGALRENIQSQDITHALISPLRSANTIVQSKAALTIAATACDVEARTEVRVLKSICSHFSGSYFWVD